MFFVQVNNFLVIVYIAHKLSLKFLISLMIFVQVIKFLVIVHIVHKLSLEFLCQDFLITLFLNTSCNVFSKRIKTVVFISWFDWCNRAVGSLALKHIWLGFMKVKQAFLDYERAKEAECVESFRSEKKD